MIMVDLVIDYKGRVFFFVKGTKQLNYFGNYQSQSMKQSNRSYIEVVEQVMKKNSRGVLGDFNSTMT